MLELYVDICVWVGGCDLKFDVSEQKQWGIFQMNQSGVMPNIFPMSRAGIMEIFSDESEWGYDKFFLMYQSRKAVIKNI
jgi:hypothetical protein